MSKQWVRQQIRHDEVKSALDHAVSWVGENRQKAAGIGGGVLLVAIVGGVLIYQSRANRAAAWERLSMAQAYAYSGRADAAVEGLKRLSEEQPGADAAAHGMIFAGDLHFQRGSYQEASGYYSKVIERGSPAALQPLALSSLALAQEAMGDFKQATLTAQRFLEAHPDHFLAPQVHASLARSLQTSGQGDLARTTLQRIQLQYPDTPWAAWAQGRLKGS